MRSACDSGLRKVKTSSVSVCPAAGLRGVAFPALPWGLARAELDLTGNRNFCDMKSYTMRKEKRKHKHTFVS